MGSMARGLCAAIVACSLESSASSQGVRAPSIADKLKDHYG